MPTKIKLISIFIIWALLFYPVYPDLVSVWLNHSNNSHGMLVPIISLYFIWNKRREIDLSRLDSSGWGLALLVLSLAIYLVSLAGGIAFFSRLMIVASLIGLVLYLMGYEVYKRLSFPLLFLVFMVPVPDSIINIVALPLQTLATKVSAGIISACAIPVYREGNMLYFVQTQLEVAEACSGIRSIVSLGMLSVLFVYFSDKGWWHKGILLASAIPIALIANMVRVSGTGILAHFYGDRVARGFLHEFSGMAVFLFGFIVLFAEFVLLNRLVKAKSASDGR